MASSKNCVSSNSDGSSSKARYRQSWTIVVKKQKTMDPHRSQTPGAPAPSAPLPPPKPLSSSTPAQRTSLARKSSSRCYSYKTGNVTQLATWFSMNAEQSNRPSAHSVKCFSPPPPQQSPLPVVKETEGLDEVLHENKPASKSESLNSSETFSRSVAKSDSDLLSTPTSLSFDSFSYQQTSSGSSTSSDSTLSVYSTAQEGNSHSGYHSNWSTPRNGSPCHDLPPSKSPNNDDKQLCSRKPEVVQSNNKTESTSEKAETCHSPNDVVPPVVSKQRFLSLPGGDLSRTLESSTNTTPYAVRVDFGLPVHDSVHLPAETGKSMLTNAIDNLLMVTGNGEMSAQNVERHVMEQTRILRAMQSRSTSDFEHASFRSGLHSLRSREPSPQEAPCVQPDLVTSATVKQADTSISFASQQPSGHLPTPGKSSTRLLTTPRTSTKAQPSLNRPSSAHLPPSSSARTKAVADLEPEVNLSLKPSTARDSLCSGDDSGEDDEAVTLDQELLLPEIVSVGSGPARYSECERLPSSQHHQQPQPPHRPPSVRSLPSAHLVMGDSPSLTSCHCPYCCSCGSPRKKLTLASRTRPNQAANSPLPPSSSSCHRRSPSIQSVPVYFPSMDNLDCPLQRFTRAASAKMSAASETSRERSSSVEPSLIRSSVKELTQTFENFAAHKHAPTGSQMSLVSDIIEGRSPYEGKPPHGRLQHPSGHRRSASLLSMRIPEVQRFSTEQFFTASSERMDGSMLSLSSGLSLTDAPPPHTHHSHMHAPSFKVGVDGSVFKDRMNTLWSWFKDFSDQQRNMLLSRMLDWCDSPQMHHLSMHMEPILHQLCPHNCQDLLSWLPSHISLQILYLLDPVSLCACRLVSRNWFKLVSQEQLWRRLCYLEKYQLSPQGQLNQLRIHTCHDGIVCWMEMFAERYRLWRNWTRGYCTIRTFEGHTQGVSCVQFDENRIVSGSSDKTIKVWNIRTNTTWAALTLEGHSGDVRCLHLKGNHLVSGSSDRTIKVWELFTDNRKWLGATCRVTMTGHYHTVRCLQSDEERVISGSYDHTLKIWNIKTGQCTHTLRGHSDHVLCLQFNDSTLVSGSGDCTIIAWDMASYQMKRTLRGHKAAVTTLQFNKSRIISGSLDRLIKIWDYRTGLCVHTLDWIHSEGHTGVIRHLQADHLKMVSAADDKTLKVWSLESGERLLTLKSHTDGVTCVQFNDRVIVSGSYDKTVKLWDFSAC